MIAANGSKQHTAMDSGQTVFVDSEVAQPPRRKALPISVLSPLRYPGGKRRLSHYIEEVLSKNKLHPKLLVEPFAGGASVSLHLVSKGVVDKIALGEKDPLVASFWKAVFFDTEWLIEEIKKVPITMDQWRKYKRSTPSTTREKALTCLFLNRTSFSGILHRGAGPIGGFEQKSEYTVDCRFPKEKIIRRLEVLKGFKDDIYFVKEGDWRQTIEAVLTEGQYGAEEVFYYLDPPFYHKANKLYNYYFLNSDHIDLCHYLSQVKKSHWLVSYDPAEEIMDMCKFNGYSTNTVDVLYTPSKTSTHKATEIIITNLKDLPDKTQLYGTTRKNE